MRIRSIDVFRGLAIVLMVLFTLMIKLSPEAGFFDHNVQGEIHPGDFVLPLFLFASGMSIVFFARKREKLKRIVFQLDVVGRFGRLLMIGMLLSLFSAGAFFGMDEVSLSAILFLLTVLLLGFSSILYIVVSLMLSVLYFSIQKLGMVSVFDSAYLGGYQGAVFYLPVMLAGAYLGKGIAGGRRARAIRSLLAFSLIAFAALALVFPIDKVRVSPSFMALAVVVGTVLFAGVDLMVERRRIVPAPLESIGKRPIRYWLLMFAFFIIPYGICVAAEACTFPMQFSLPIALAACAMFMVFLGIIDELVERVKGRTA